MIRQLWSELRYRVYLKAYRLRDRETVPVIVTLSDFTNRWNAEAARDDASVPRVRPRAPGAEATPLSLSDFDDKWNKEALGMTSATQAGAQAKGA